MFQLFSLLCCFRVKHLLLLRIQTLLLASTHRVHCLGFVLWGGHGRLPISALRFLWLLIHLTKVSIWLRLSVELGLFYLPQLLKILHVLVIKSRVSCWVKLALIGIPFSLLDVPKRGLDGVVIRLLDALVQEVDMLAVGVEIYRHKLLGWVSILLLSHRLLVVICVGDSRLLIISSSLCHQEAPSTPIWNSIFFPNDFIYLGINLSFLLPCELLVVLYW